MPRHADPDAHPAELDLLCCWYVLMWFFDDQLQAAYERDPASLKRGVDRFMLFLPVVPQLVPVPENAAERAATDLWARTAPAMSPVWRERFTRAFRAFGEGHRWSDRAVHREIDLVDFVELRRVVGGGMLMTCLLEHDTGVEIPPAIYRSRPFTALLDVFRDAIDLQNDIVSYAREHALGEGELNGVTVFQRALGGSLQGAVDTIDRLLTGRIRTMCSAADVDLPTVLVESNLGEITGRRVQDYVRALQTMLAGGYAWALQSRRYHAAPTFVSIGPTGLGTSAARLPRR